jgi:hypothetical protein
VTNQKTRPALVVGDRIRLKDPHRHLGGKFTHGYVEEFIAEWGVVGVGLSVPGSPADRTVNRPFARFKVGDVERV